MKIEIGPYVNWVGPYQIADLLQKIGVSKDRCYEIGEILSNTWVNDFCNWVHSKRTRKIKIKIDKYDTWNMDDTLALIISPMLKQLKETQHGAGRVDNEDVPKELWATQQPLYDVDENYFKRWDWVLNEMIWAFEHHSQNDVLKFSEADVERIKNGFRLFGKYYLNLWD